MNATRHPADHLLYSADEDDLRATVRAFLSEAATATSILARIETDEPYAHQDWVTLAYEIGLAGLPIAEEAGGVGATWREVAVVAEEIGRTVAPLPFLGTVLATATLLGTPQRPDTLDLLAAIAAGPTLTTLAVPLTASPTSDIATTVGADGLELTGTVNAVADLAPAQRILVPAQTADGSVGLYLVDADSDGVGIESVTSLDLTRPIAALRLRSAPATLLAHGHDAEAALRRALSVGAAILAAEQVGIAAYCLDSTVEYVKTRYQFGRPVGSYQAVKHRLAELHVNLGQARAAARYAASCVAEADRDAPIAVGVAQAFCSRTAIQAAEEAIQLHGGIGFTWEHPAHLYLKRAKADQLALGSAEAHHATLATLLDLPA
ncbi:acyl-CoA dehydrogenase family protein [Nocardia sp. NPDC047654]|uniref:acyl-CoA dehydrogenase family protein n=1 Tax=Nocardia sp. NPDC047654 TaxID=3364314 RepID=UPI0037244B6A